MHRSRSYGQQLLLSPQVLQWTPLIFKIRGRDNHSWDQTMSGWVILIKMILVYSFLSRKGGFIGLIGLPKVSTLHCCFHYNHRLFLQTPIHVEKPLENVVFKSLTLKTVHGRKIFHTWKQTEKIFAEKKYATSLVYCDAVHYLLSYRIDTKLFVTHDIPMSQYEEVGSAHISRQIV